ncbi:MAG: nucleotidyl transferase AbiEii/AbiGii toxin family protein [Eubacteriales bacterium]
MANLDGMIATVIREGYSQANAAARVCQDIVLKAISKSSFADHITVKGGVVMRSITGDARRATQDMDLDFIRYSLEEESIRRFIGRLNCLDGISIRISAPIEELSQQEYHGKRVFVIIEDDTGHSLRSKIDLGVHKQVQIEQDEYCFDVCMDDEGVSLLINSREQIFTEKLRSLLKFGPLSTRYKDIFDMCYLSSQVQRDRLMRYLDTYIFEDPGMLERSISDIRNRVQRTFGNRAYRQRLERSGSANWMGITPAEAMKTIEDFLGSI